MPIVTITVRKPKTAAFKSIILDAVHAALVEAGVNANDRFHRVLESEVTISVSIRHSPTSNPPGMTTLC